MNKKARTPARGLSAAVTIIRLLPGVNFLVLSKRIAAAEGILAVFTLTGLLASVNSLMLTKLIPTPEGFPTALT